MTSDPHAEPAAQGHRQGWNSRLLSSSLFLTQTETNAFPYRSGRRGRLRAGEEHGFRGQSHLAELCISHLLPAAGASLSPLRLRLEGGLSEIGVRSV